MTYRLFTKYTADLYFILNNPRIYNKRIMGSYISKEDLEAFESMRPTQLTDHVKKSQGILKTIYYNRDVVVECKEKRQTRKEIGSDILQVREKECV